MISVRQPDLWSSDPVRSALIETLGFLSDDDYEIEFRRLDHLSEVADYFEFPHEERIAFSPQEVILFSGGLDFLPGRSRSWLSQRKDVALVSHRSATKIAGAQQHLIDQLGSGLVSAACSTFRFGRI